MLGVSGAWVFFWISHGWRLAYSWEGPGSIFNTVSFYLLVHASSKKPRRWTMHCFRLGFLGNRPWNMQQYGRGELQGSVQDEWRRSVTWPPNRLQLVLTLGSSGVGTVLQGGSGLRQLQAPATGYALPLGRGHELRWGRAIPREGPDWEPRS